MKALQSLWSLSGELFVWAEFATQDNAQLLDEAHNRRHSSQHITSDICLDATDSPPAPAMHPFSWHTSNLGDYCEQAGCDAFRETFIDLYIPTDDFGPLLSPRLVTATDFPRRGPVELRPWRIPAISLDPYSSINFLTSLPSDAVPGLILDDSLLFWLEATKLVLELLTRGRFLPSLQNQNGNYLAIWQVVTSAEQDVRRMQILASSMPPICRAIADNNGSHVEPSMLLESFIAKSADCLIRTFLKRSPLIPTPSSPAIATSASIETQWLNCLCKDVAIIDAPARDILKLEQQLKRWQQTFSQTSPSELRTGLSLAEVANGLFLDSNAATHSQWKLEFFIESLNNPTDRLAADSLWRGQLGFLKLANTSFEELEERLLKDLGHASRLFPALNRALHDACPTAIYLSTEEAYAFLKHAAPLLSRAGFGVSFPTWWTNPRLSLGLQLNVSSPAYISSRSASVGFNQLVDYSWSISLGDKTLSIDDFSELLQQQSPLVKIDDSWIELCPKQIESTMSFLRANKTEGKMRVIDAFRYGLGVSSISEGLPITKLAAVGWIDVLLNSNNLITSDIEQPCAFHGTLRHYQLQGLAWLHLLGNLGFGACLADDMGLGKTIQLLALLLLEREAQDGDSTEESSSNIKPTLLIAPMSIIDNWQREAAKFAPSLRLYVHHGGERATSVDFQTICTGVDIVITTYSLAHRDEELLSTVCWGRIVLDEAQNIKNLATKQTKAIRRLALQQIRETENDEPNCNRIAMSGTPLENHLEELWSIFDFLNPGYLGSLSDFRSRFVLPVERYRNIDASQSLSKLVAPFILRRTKNNKSVIDDLPEKIEMDVFTELTPEQAILYRRAVDEMLAGIAQATGLQRKGLVLATITKLKQICNHPALYLKDNGDLTGRSCKLSRLEELLEEILDEGDKTLIFSQFAQMGHLLKRHLQEKFGQEVLFLHGALPKQKRTELVDRFQKNDGPKIFVLSLKVGGLGLTLTAANQIIHYDQWWNPAVQNQATDRAYRIGQKRNVQVRTFICKGTLEENISGLITKKKDLAEQVVSSTKNVITQMSVEELRTLIQLNSKDYIGE